MAKSAEQIRVGLRETREARETADELKASATARLRALLGEADQAGVSMTEAAELAGLTRKGAYEILRGRY